MSPPKSHIRNKHGDCVRETSLQHRNLTVLCPTSQLISSRKFCVLLWCLKFKYKIHKDSTFTPPPPKFLHQKTKWLTQSVFYKTKCCKHVATLLHPHEHPTLSHMHINHYLHFIKKNLIRMLRNTNSTNSHVCHDHDKAMCFLENNQFSCKMQLALLKCQSSSWVQWHSGLNGMHTLITVCQSAK
jgi:hypothetical protein